YVLNHKRAHLRGLEERFQITITVSADASVTGQQSYVVDRGEQVHSPEAARALAAQVSVDEEEPDYVEAEEETAEEDVATEARAEGEEDAEPAGEHREGEPRR